MARPSRIELASARLAQLKRSARSGAREAHVALRRITVDGTRVVVTAARGPLALLELGAVRIVLDARDAKILGAGLTAAAKVLGETRDARE